MGRSPKSSSHQKQKRRRDSSSSSSPDSGHRHHHRRPREEQSREDGRSRSNVRVKQERHSDDDQPYQQRHHKSFDASTKNRRPPPENQDKNYQWGKQTHKEKPKEAPVEKEKPNFSLSGALLKDTNTYKGVVIKYSEPIEARKPKRRWRFYVFKGEQELPMYQIHRQSAYLIGRDRTVCDLPVDHPSCSKQHAVLQYRLMDYKRDDGGMGRRVIPYVIDLGSANGTFLNNQKIDPQRYYELRENDILKFGFSTREYVLLHEDSAAGLEPSGNYEDDGIEIKKEPVEPTQN